jgi:hypothetical protein
MVDPSAAEDEVLRPYLAAERNRPDPPPETGERVYGRLAASLGLPPASAPTVPSPPPAPAPPASLAGPGASLVALVARRAVTVLLAGAAASVLTYATVTHVRHAAGPGERPPASVPAPPVSPAQPSVPPAVAEPVAAPPAPARPDGPAAHEGRDRGLAAERAQIDAARTALAQGRAPEAYAALRRHGRLFPNGRLAEERESLLVQALVAEGRFAEARQNAARFVRRYPQSLFQSVVEESLRSIP